ncbi:MAG: hypothetical protein AAB304_04850 [Pseudomonadota bacterium]
MYNLFIRSFHIDRPDATRLVGKVRCSPWSGYESVGGPPHTSVSGAIDINNSHTREQTRGRPLARRS